MGNRKKSFYIFSSLSEETLEIDIMWGEHRKRYELSLDKDNIKDDIEDMLEDLIDELLNRQPTTELEKALADVLTTDTSTNITDISNSILET